MSENLDKIKAIKKKVKNGKLKIERKDIKAQVLKDVKETSKEREEICSKAREKAHTAVADAKRDMSNEIRKHTQTLSEGYDFIEESLGSGCPEFTFYDEPQSSENITEAFGEDSKYGMIGVAEGVFAPIGVMSRNNRMYDNDHYDYLLENQMLVDKIANRGMLGTIGHHDKRVDDQDLAEGKVSHIVTDLHIQEEADGTRNLVGRLEILNTPAGNLLKTYYDSGMPLYVSSRGAGRLLNVANESYKRVDKTNYYLETFDIVRDPGFLGAKPKYLKESIEEPVKEEVDNNIIGENNMDNKKVIPAIDTKMEAEDIVNKLLNPLQEQLAELTETVKLLSDKVLVEEAVEETKEEVSEEKAEEVKAEEVVSEEKAEDEKEAEEKAEEEKVDEAVEETKEEVSEECEPKKETEDDEAEKPAPVAEAVEEEKAEEEKVEEAKEEEVSEEKAEEPAKETEDDEAENPAPVAEAVEETKEEVSEEKVEEACEEKDEDKEEAEEEKVEEAKEEEVSEEKTEEVSEEHDCECEKEAEEDKEDEKEECDEAKEEVIDYEAKFKESEAVMNDLVKMVSEASARSKALVEKYELAMKELNAYKLSEELSITIDEAKEKLETKSYEEIKEEAKVEEIAEPVAEEVSEEKVEETKEEIVESKKAIKPVFSRFSAINESKKSTKKGFSIFG